MALGVDPVALLRCDALTLVAVVDSLPFAQEWMEARDESLARRIINELAKAMK